MNRIPPSVLEQAAHWLVRVDAEPSCRGDFEAWCAADPTHEAAARSLGGVIERLAVLPTAPANAALRAARRSGPRRGLQTLALAALISLPAALYLQHNPPSYLLADIRTATGEWRTEPLEDGSQLALNGHSAVNLQFDAQQRTLHLLQGEILVEVAADASRPFIVQTTHGAIRALGTRFIVDADGRVTQLDMLESRVEVRTGKGIQQFSAGQRVRLSAEGIGSTESFDPDEREQAWRQRQLLVEDRPLPEVLAELARHRSGHLGFNATALEHLRVSAVLPLDEPDKALRLLARSFPIEVQQLTPWWTRVKPITEK
ncbi:MAG: FecR family protein [Pseudomonas sp.]